MKKFIPALALVIASIINSHAAVVNQQTAQTIATNFYKVTFAASIGHSSINAVIKYTHTDADNAADFYVFDIQPVSGFVIVSAHDEVMPVLAYSSESYFKLDFQNSGLANWVNKTAGQIHATVVNHINADERIRNSWSAYLAGTQAPSEKSSGVGPMLTTTWNQLPYYNMYCPVNPADGQRSVTGCVATAMAQIMKYWNYPPQGTGSYSYVDDNAHGYQINAGTLSANFGTTTYQWTQMPNYLTANNTAIGTLMYHCGVSVAMDYSDEGSGAYVIQSEANAAYGYAGAPCAQHSYATYFGYNPNTLQGVFQSHYTTTQWDNIIEAEFNAGRVVQYEGFDPSAGGHTWVCDGYDVNNRLHMNWGWGGAANGFYAATNLSAGGYTFNYDDAALIGIEPPTYAPPGTGTCVAVRTDSVHTPFSHVFSVNPTSIAPQYGEWPTQHWTWNGTPGETRGLMKFDVSFIPAHAYVTGASISYYADTNASNGYHNEPTYGTNNACYLMQVTSAWSPTSVDWNNQPAATTTGQVLFPQSTTNAENYLGYDITGFVRNWYQNPASNYGVMMQMIGSNYYNLMDFCSPTYPDTSKRPLLQVCYLPCNASAAFTYQSLGGSLIQFTNTSTSSQPYTNNWTFYNGSGQFATSTATNPQVTFLGQPPYSARLVITDTLGTGCVDTILQTITFNPNTTCLTFQHGNTKCTGAEVNSLASEVNTNYNFTTFTECYGEQWTNGGVQTEGRGLIKYNLSSIPAGTTIISAHFSIYADPVCYNGSVNNPTYGSNNASYLYHITSAWNPGTVTWNNQPGIDTAGQVLLAQSANYDEDYTNLDVTRLVQNWIANPNSNYGMMLKIITPNIYNAMVFCSSSYADTTKWPKLDICFIPPHSCQIQGSFVQQNLGGGQVLFTNTSTDNYPFNSNWIFYNAGGQIGSSAQANPTFQFTGAQPYSAKLIITDSLCADTILQPVTLSNCITIKTGKVTGASISSLPADANNNFDFANGYGEFIAEQWTNGGIPAEVRSLIRFDMSHVPPGSIIQSAKLSLYADTMGFNGRYGQPMYGNNTSYLDLVNGAWNPATVTWNTQPTVTTTGQILMAQSTVADQDYTDIDVSNWVQNWVNNPSTNKGMMLKMVTPVYYNSMIFCSSAHPDSTKWPKLEICYLTASPCHLAATFSEQNMGNNTEQFFNTSAGSANTVLQWTFYNANGNIGTSVATNPIETFTGMPPYSATLKITDTVTGCTDTINHMADIAGCIVYQSGIHAGAGASISSLPSQMDSDYNYNNFTEFLAEQWTNGGVPAEVRGLLKYDLSQIPVGSSILSATLNLYTDTLNYNGYIGEPTYGNNNACNLQQITAAWNPASVTWNTQPPSTSAGQIPLTQSTNYNESYLNIDLSNWVQGWVNNPANNNGFMLKMVTQNHYNSMIFGSPSYHDSTRRPMLDVCYTTNPTPPACGIYDSFTYYNLSGDTMQFVNQSLPAQGFSSQWTFYNGNGPIANSTLTNPVQVFTGQGPYYATLVITDTVNHNCTDSFTLQVFAAPVLNIDGVNGSLFIYPNPNNGSYFNVRLPADYNTQTTELKVYDITGREVGIDNIDKHTGMVSLSMKASEPGIYTVVAIDKAKQQCGKLVLVK